MFCLSGKCIQRGGSLSKELKSMKGNETQHFMLSSFAPDTGMCVRVGMFVWPVSQNVKAGCDVYYFISQIGRLYGRGFRCLNSKRCQFEILIKKFNSTCFCSFSIFFLAQRSRNEIGKWRLKYST